MVGHAWAEAFSTSAFGTGAVRWIESDLNWGLLTREAGAGGDGDQEPPAGGRAAHRHARRKGLAFISQHAFIYQL